MTTRYINGELRNVEEIEAEAMALWTLVKEEFNDMDVFDSLYEICQYLPTKIKKNQMFREWKRMMDANKLLNLLC